MRLRVVGRREEPTQVAIPSLAPGLPQQMQWATAASLLVVPVDDDGKVINVNTPMGGSGPVSIAAKSLEDLSEFVTDQIYTLVAE